MTLNCFIFVSTKISSIAKKKKTFGQCVKSSIEHKQNVNLSPGTFPYNVFGALYLIDSLFGYKSS